MSDFHLNTPVALLIFNRPQSTQQVFDAIRRACPSKLLIVADGPRPNRRDDISNCLAAQAIVKQVDWPCEVLTNFSEINLGCKIRMSSGISWVFNKVDEAIILEDDCLPHSSFFQYCQELLVKYRDDVHIMHINGANFLFDNLTTEYSYFFSRYSHVWGWASWKRAWQNYDVNLSVWRNPLSIPWLRTILGQPQLVQHWSTLFDEVKQGRIDTWDYQWQFAKWVQNGLSISPKVNLITNIGFDKQATHTLVPTKAANMPLHPISFPLQHPHYVKQDSKAESIEERDQIRTPLSSAIKRLKQKAYQIIKG